MKGGAKMSLWISRILVITILIVEHVFEKKNVKLLVGMGMLALMTAMVFLACYFEQAEARTMFMRGFISVGMMVRFAIYKFINRSEKGGAV